MSLTTHKPHLFKIGCYWVCRCKKGNIGIGVDSFRAYLDWMGRVKI